MWNALVQKHIGASMAQPEAEKVVIDRSTIETITHKDEGKATKVINLIKAYPSGVVLWLGGGGCAELTV